jgi:hypothetical protein
LLYSCKCESLKSPICFVCMATLTKDIAGLLDDFSPSVGTNERDHLNE